MLLSKCLFIAHCYARAITCQRRSRRLLTLAIYLFSNSGPHFPAQLGSSSHWKWMLLKPCCFEITKLERIGVRAPKLTEKLFSSLAIYHVEVLYHYLTKERGEGRRACLTNAAHVSFCPRTLTSGQTCFWLWHRARVLAAAADEVLSPSQTLPWGLLSTLTRGTCLFHGCGRVTGLIKSWNNHRSASDQLTGRVALGFLVIYGDGKGEMVWLAENVVLCCLLGFMYFWFLPKRLVLDNSSAAWEWFALWGFNPV